ncbi:MAG: PASTA domain-containing protein [Muribaculaceae bacterium]|nr:PASTA domain-containing protein [Muribaculaceae bacterium]
MNSTQSSIIRFYTRHRIISNLIIMLFVAIILVWCAMIFLNVWTNHGSTSTVPQVRNLSYTTAAQLLHDCDLKIEIADSVYERNAAPGTVLESWPKAGAVVKRGRQVYVTITAFSPKMVRITMPVAGVSSRQAISYLRGIGITGIRIVTVPSQYADLVESATVDGKPLHVDSEIPINATVTLEVGAVPEPIAESDSIIADVAASAVEAVEDAENSIFD